MSINDSDADPFAIVDYGVSNRHGNAFIQDQT